MRIRDWSSDVCSSDLVRLVPAAAVERKLHAHHVGVLRGDAAVAGADVAADLLEGLHGAVSRSRMAAMLAQWPKRPPSSASSPRTAPRSEEHPSELQSLLRISHGVFFLKNKKNRTN